jgi:hypothetical protein
MLTKLNTVKARGMVLVGLRMAAFIGAVTLTLVAVLSLGKPALADAPPRQEFGAGRACSFPLRIDFSGGHRVDREFTDKNGNPVRILSAGKGFLETFTNLDTGVTVTYKTGGSVSQIIVNPDGSLTFVATGHNVIILFPEDEPAGPSTILYLGRFVATVDPITFVGTVQEITGTQIDICAALS